MYCLKNCISCMKFHGHKLCINKLKSLFEYQYGIRFYKHLIWNPWLFWSIPQLCSALNSYRCLHPWPPRRPLQGREGDDDHRPLAAPRLPRRIHPHHGIHGLQRRQPGINQPAGRRGLYRQGSTGKV